MRFASRCVNCDEVLYENSKFITVNGDRICEECIENMRPREILDLLEIDFECVGEPEEERI